MIAHREWIHLDPELRAEIDELTAPYQAPIKIEKAYAQTLTTWITPFDTAGHCQFKFDLGEKANRLRVVLNAKWGNTGAGNTHATNRWVEELQYLFRNFRGIKIYKATAYLPGSQDFQTWCQFVEVRQYAEPLVAYVIWNGEVILESKAKPVWRDSARDWTFDWRNKKTLEQLLAAVK